MRERSLNIRPTIGADDDDTFVVGRSARGSFWSKLLRRRLREWLMIVGATLAVGMVMINALFLQSGPHPAPIFANRPPPIVTGHASPMLLPRPRPAGAKADLSVPVRPRQEIIADIQRELAQRGFFDGSADGVYGAKTDLAIRDFEQAATLRPSAEPSEALLRTIARSTIKATAAVTPSRDPIADLLAPSKRMIALQRVLADYGYGPIRPTGIYDPETRGAIEQFERYRKLPVTGQISERVTRELTAMTGRPLE